MSYVIYLSSELRRHDHSNSYGYWDGETYTRDGLVFPICSTRITEEIKVYKSKKRAEKMSEKLLDRCAYVMTYYIEDY